MITLGFRGPNPSRKVDIVSDNQPRCTLSSSYLHAFTSISHTTSFKHFFWHHRALSSSIIVCQHSLVRNKKQKTRFVTLEQYTTWTRASFPKSFYIDTDRHRFTLPFCPSCSSPSPGCDSLHCLSLLFLSSPPTRTSFVSLFPLRSVPSAR